VLGATYSDNYSVRANDVERKYRVSAFDPSVPEDRRVPNVEYNFTRGSRAVKLGTIANFTYLLTQTNKLSLRTTFNRNTDDEARRYEGDNKEDLDGLVRSDRLRFISRALYWGQLAGEHQTLLGSRLEWRATMARAKRDEPGLRETIYLNSTTSDPSDPHYLENVGESGRYLWSDLVDDDRNFEVDWQFPFYLGAVSSGYVKVGGAWRDRERDFEAYRYNWQFLGGIVTDIDDQLSDENIVGSRPGPSEFAIDDVVEPGDLYSAFDKRRAAYVMVEMPIGYRLRAIAGARVESYDMDIESRGDTLSGVNETSVLPAVNLVYQLSRNMNLRAAYSGTVDRPEFRELAPFQFTEASSLRQLFGNPELKTSKITSFDLRWDWFRHNGQLLSISTFYKRLDEPIEQVFVAAASSAFSFQNADEAVLYGVEFDARQRLDVLSEFLQDFSVQGNLSLIESNVTVRQTGTFQPTNLERPLEGQSSYSVNLGMLYRHPIFGTDVGVFYSRFGQRLTAAGGFGVPGIYEQSRHQLDATFKQRVRGGLRFKAKASNLLNQPFRFLQEAEGITQIQREYSTGVSFSLGMSFEF
jgi:TonB-dependent receptor